MDFFSTSSIELLCIYFTFINLFFEAANALELSAFPSSFYGVSGAFSKKHNCVFRLAFWWDFILLSVLNGFLSCCFRFLAYGFIVLKQSTF